MDKAPRTEAAAELDEELIVLPRDDPRITALARQLEITMIQRAWIDEATLYIQTPYDTLEVAHETNTAPTPDGAGVETTLPRGSAQPANSRTGGSAPPQDPEPPTAPTAGSGLDDYTAIHGVGSVTAQRLHDKGLYTYEDLRTWLELVEEDDDISPHTLGQIEAWFEERLV